MGFQGKCLFKAGRLLSFHDFHTHIFSKFIFQYQRIEGKSLLELHADYLRFLAGAF